MSNKYGIEIKIDVTKIDKARLFEGKKGKYLTMTAFIDVENEDQYGNNGMVTHKKEQGEDKAPILGNARVFWSGTSQQEASKPSVQQPNGMDDFEDDIPFSNYELRYV